MKKLTLQATSRHPDYKAGEHYEADKRQAQIDLASRRAEAPKKHVPEIRVKRKYRRRDMEAE